MKRVVAVVCMICFFSTVFAQEEDTVSRNVRILTYQEAVKLGLKNGMLLNQQRNLLEYNQMLKISNYAGLGPTLSAGAGAGRVNGNTFNPNEGRVINGVFDQLSGSISANQVIFNGFGQVNRARQSNALLDAQVYYVNRSQQDIINTISSQYLSVLLDGELLKIARENFRVLSKQLNLVDEQVKLGAKAPADFYNQDALTKAALVSIYQAEMNLISDKQLLVQTLLIDPEDEFEVSKPLWDVNEVGSDNLDLASYYDIALKNRADYLRSIRNEDAAKYGAKAFKAYMTPTLSAYAQLYSAYNHAHGDTTTRPFKNQIQLDNLKKYYGFQLNVPIFGGSQNFINRTNYVQQKVLYENAGITRKNAEIQVKTDVYKAYKTFNLVRKSYTASANQLASAELAFQYETERYNIGVTDFVTYNNANKVLVQSQTAKAQAEYKLVFQKILMAYAAGTLKPEDIQD